MAPWVHLSVQPFGVFPCCYNGVLKLGDLHETTLREIWNNEKMRNLRRTMLRDEPVDHCVKCLAIEQRGFASPRHEFNSKWAHHFPKVATTAEDGTFETFNYVAFDIRFNNLCNMKCRTCGPFLSSKWSEDRPLPEGGALLEAGVSFDEIDQLIPTVETIYFAGGEAMIQEEHYVLLEKLIAAQRYPRLTYNSNGSRLGFKHWNAIELWRHFPFVGFNVSLDQIGDKAQYVRHGIRWSVIVKNLERLRDDAPHVSIQPALTVSLFNILDLPTIIDYLVTHGFARDGHVNFNNILTAPAEFSIQVLPRHLKEIADRRLQDYLAGPRTEYCRTRIARIRDFMWLADGAEHLPALRAELAAIDRLRGESFAATFPELACLVG